MKDWDFKEAFKKAQSERISGQGKQAERIAQKSKCSHRLHGSD